MKVKNHWLLMIGLLATSGIILVDRFIIDVPDWMAIICIVIAIVSYIMFLFSNRKFKSR